MTDAERWDQDWDRHYFRTVGPALYRMAYDGWVAAWQDPFQLKREADQPAAFTADVFVWRDA